VLRKNPLRVADDDEDEDLEVARKRKKEEEGDGKGLREIKLRSRFAMLNVQ
jgi:hypothetical protein